MMKEWLDQFLSDFHRGYLKELGFKKTRRTFSRDMGDYCERFNFQGSTSNYPDHESWRFYLNVGVEFKGLESRRYWSLFPHTHWAVRVASVVPSAPSKYEYNLQTNREGLMLQLSSYLQRASEKIARESEGIRLHYLAGDSTKGYIFDEI
jgi:hypothetical protein